MMYSPALSLANSKWPSLSVAVPSFVFLITTLTLEAGKLSEEITVPLMLPEFFLGNGGDKTKDADNCYKQPESLAIHVHANFAQM